MGWGGERSPEAARLGESLTLAPKPSSADRLCSFSGATAGGALPSNLSVTRRSHSFGGTASGAGLGSFRFPELCLEAP